MPGRGPVAVTFLDKYNDTTSGCGLPMVSLASKRGNHRKPRFVNLKS